MFKDRSTISGKIALACFLIFAVLGNQSNGQTSQKKSLSIDQVSASRIIAAIQDYILNHEDVEPWQIKVDCDGLLNDIPAITVHTPLRVSSIKKAPFYGKNSFMISYQISSGKWKTFRIAPRIRRFINVLVAAKRLQRHQVITGNEFKLEKRQVIRVSNEYGCDIKSIIGKRTKRIVLAGTVLKNSVIEEVPLVERGQMVTALIVKKNLTISFPAKANQPGCIGDVITLRDMFNNRIIKAEVVENGTVIVEM